MLFLWARTHVVLWYAWFIENVMIILFDISTFTDNWPFYPLRFTVIAPLMVNWKLVQFKEDQTNGWPSKSMLSDNCLLHVHKEGNVPCIGLLKKAAVSG